MTAAWILLGCALWLAVAVCVAVVIGRVIARREHQKPQHPGAGTGYQCQPVPVPPFDDIADERVAFGATFVHVTHTITGRWPSATDVQAVLAVIYPDLPKDQP